MSATKRNRNKVRRALRALPPGLTQAMRAKFEAGLHRHLKSSPNAAGKVKGTPPMSRISDQA